MTTTTAATSTSLSALRDLCNKTKLELALIRNTPVSHEKKAALLDAVEIMGQIFQEIAKGQWLETHTSSNPCPCKPCLQRDVSNLTTTVNQLPLNLTGKAYDVATRAAAIRVNDQRAALARDISAGVVEQRTVHDSQGRVHFRPLC